MVKWSKKANVRFIAVLQSSRYGLPLLSSAVFLCAQPECAREEEGKKLSKQEKKSGAQKKTWKKRREFFWVDRPFESPPRPSSRSTFGPGDFSGGVQ